MRSILFTPVDSPYLVPYDESFKVSERRTSPKDPIGKKKAKALLAESTEKLQKIQRMFYAHDQYAVLLVFQAMDAAGKDGTIRAVMTGVNPAGCQVYSFKRPSAKELDHDFLWRVHQCLPERGRIGIFNRSHYEEVLAVRVEPAFLAAQKLPLVNPKKVWERRYESIRNFEQHLARNGTVIVKFWLNVSKEEQKRRLLKRIDEPESNWKFSADDLRTRAKWDDYMDAYEDALNATSRPWAPWYAIPADDKPFMRWQVADIVRKTLEGLPISYPELDGEKRANLVKFRDMLTHEHE